MLRVAATCVGTRALGPGVRSVVWVQGCPFRCRGCVAPEWIPEEGGRSVAVADLADEVLADPDVDGLTLSGGEPMAQAAALAELVGVVRARRDVSVVCFTGYTLGRLRRMPDAAALLSEVDVLIDGQYVERLNDGVGMRGSANQTVHHLTGRLAGFDFAGAPRSVEIRVGERDVTLVGVPPKGLLGVLDRALGS
ncbi:4Fe-4S single cluster domain-containing protein [Actinokineospora fastidiosa]|uniref:Anaerobic ribonucleoside-triphosphate reductase activating protein n=1 Tax=Actinokineospora fastidiosa TaxID=1816 RepID=A0A918GSN6_9PSEU|nr:4Fe-4S single cluster domain-containing protein [Actinokineospora fastidiosa]GGS54851.1 anaerobic ribonucleoside-triphosphate reductase activating protein [Actinokineospora fastidiosa]